MCVGSGPLIYINYMLSSQEWKERCAGVDTEVCTRELQMSIREHPNIKFLHLFEKPTLDFQFANNTPTIRQQFANPVPGKTFYPGEGRKKERREKRTVFDRPYNRLNFFVNSFTGMPKKSTWIEEDVKLLPPGTPIIYCIPNSE